MRDGRMRFLILILCTLFLTNCYPATHPVEPTPHKPIAAATGQPAAVLPTPLAPLAAPRFTSLETAGITFEGVAFDSRSARLVVDDQPEGPGAQFTDAATAAAARNGIAAINAGFFTPEGAPLGLVVSSGKVAGTWNSSSSLGSGVWFENTSGSTSIVRRENLGRTRASAASELIQAGPLLIENNNPVSGLESSKSSVRSIIISDGATRWWIGRSSPCTLAALGQALSTARPGGWPVRQALNLDGGRSSDLWVSASVSGGPVTQRAPWNRPVRNFLVLTQR